MESTLRARVRAGDPGAFADLFDTYARSVYNHAFRLTADWATAEDVMAATYLQAGDVGVFDLTGSGAEAVATTRSQTMAVSGLNAEDPAASGHGFRTTLGQLRAVAAQAK
ncbi:RNA polymerase sigma factor [Micromonospora arida]|uniref:RNA polymerase sigma factor n=1 Tax=Micromonospora arida TaxID=2203715 RepID=UPI001ABF581F|nr:hypothetical protein [Micromonospora arida]